MATCKKPKREPLLTFDEVHEQLNKRLPDGLYYGPSAYVPQTQRVLDSKIRRAKRFQRQMLKKFGQTRTRRFNSFLVLMDAQAAGRPANVMEVADFIRRRLIARHLVKLSATQKRRRPKQKTKRGR